MIFITDIDGNLINAHYVVRITKVLEDSQNTAIYLHMVDKRIYTFYVGKEADAVLSGLVAQLINPL